MLHFDAKKAAEGNIRFLRKWFDGFSDKSTAVIGISGGKDSTIAAKLLVEALGHERVLGVMMPNGVQHDQMDARHACELLEIPNTTINIQTMYDIAKVTFRDHELIQLTDELLINLAPRIRMTILYAVAQGQLVPAFVANTCNRSEDYVGFSTKYGDAAGDIAVLQDFLVSEVMEIGDYLGLPRDLVHKTPCDGLTEMTDEESLGFKYEDLDKYLKWRESKKGACPVNSLLVNAIEKRHAANLHKLRPMPSCASRRKKIK